MGSSFHRARFAASGAEGDFGGGDGFEEMLYAADGLAGGGGAPDDPCPSLEPVDAAFEARACGLAAAAGDEAAQEVIGDHVQEEFALEHGGAFGAQPVHLQGGFDVVEEEFDAPAPGVEVGAGFARVGGGIKERGDEDERGCAKAFLFATRAHFADNEEGGQGGIGVRSSIQGGRTGLGQATL